MSSPLTAKAGMYVILLMASSYVLQSHDESENRTPMETTLFNGFQRLQIKTKTLR